MITKPTQITEISSTLVDLIIMNQPEDITNKDVVANPIADHHISLAWET